MLPFLTLPWTLMTLPWISFIAQLGNIKAGFCTWLMQGCLQCTISKSAESSCLLTFRNHCNLQQHIIQYTVHVLGTVCLQDVKGFLDWCEEWGACGNCESRPLLDLLGSSLLDIWNVNYLYFVLLRSTVTSDSRHPLASHCSTPTLNWTALPISIASACSCFCIVFKSVVS